MLGVHLEFLRQSLPASATDLEQEIGEIYRQIGDLASDIQALSHGLHSPKLELIGLKAAVAGFCDELSNRHDVAIDLHFENIPESTAIGKFPSASTAFCKKPCRMSSSIVCRAAPTSR